LYNFGADASGVKMYRRFHKKKDNEINLLERNFIINKYNKVLFLLKEEQKMQ
jgi:hypothetical protein